MAINMEELLRPFGRPNVVEVGRVPQPPATLPQPARAPVAAPAPMQAPQAAERPRGLLGGFFGPEGRDARSRLAIGLEGLAMNPNQALIGQLQQGIESRATTAQKNATMEWLISRGRDDLAAALEAGASPQDVLAEAMRPAAAAERGVVVGGNVVDPITGEIIYQGQETPVDTAPATFRAMDMQARAAGLKPQSEGGDGSYENFMLTRGAGYSAEAGAVGTARGEAIAGAPGKIALANMIDTQVNELLSDPYLPQMLGPMASRLPNISGEAARVQSKMDQILGGAFLQARDLLKGGGAITDFESQKAEGAFIRMNAAQNEADFRSAMRDFQSAVRSGMSKLDEIGGGGMAPSGGAVPGLSDEDLKYLE